jgi:hypothetical protein
VKLTAETSRLLVLPDFLKKSFHLNLTTMSWWTSAFYVIVAVGGVVGG